MRYDVVDNPAAGRFEIRVDGDGEVAGFAEYTRKGRALSVTHVEVDPGFKGQGLGSALARGLLRSIRDEHTSVLPVCPFLRDYIDRHPEHLDLVPSDQRARFALSQPEKEPGGGDSRAGPISPSR